MIVDVVVAGVGGQGALSTAHFLADAAHRAGRHVVQGELHGMSQRRGAVQAIVRISDTPVGAAQVGEGRAHLLVGLEPVEALRNLPFLAADGRFLVSTHPEPDMDEIGRAHV
jgi:indolepyruvate ferredoxin oxidoreductase beta subunit